MVTLFVTFVSTLDLYGNLLQELVIVRPSVLLSETLLGFPRFVRRFPITGIDLGQTHLHLRSCRGISTLFLCFYHVKDACCKSIGDAANAFTVSLKFGPNLITFDYNQKQSVPWNSLVSFLRLLLQYFTVSILFLILNFLFLLLDYCNKRCRSYSSYFTKYFIPFMLMSF